MENNLQVIRKLHLLIILVSVTLILFSATKDWNHIDNIKKAITQLNILYSYTNEDFTKNALKYIYTSENNYTKLVKTLNENFTKFKSEYKPSLSKELNKKLVELKKLGLPFNADDAAIKKLIDELKKKSAEITFLKHQGLSEATAPPLPKINNLEAEVSTLKNTLKRNRLTKKINEIKDALTNFGRISISYNFVIKNINTDTDTLSEVISKLNSFNKVITESYIRNAWGHIEKVFENNIPLLKYSDYYQIIPREGIAFYIRNRPGKFNITRLVKQNAFNRNHIIKKSSGSYSIGDSLYTEIIFHLKDIVKIETEDVNIFQKLFPELSEPKIIREIKQSKYDSAEQSLYKFLNDEQDKDTLELVGLKVSAKNIAIIGPVVIIVLLYYMLAVMVHIFRIKDRVDDLKILKTYVWMGLFENNLAWLLTPLTLIVFNLSAVILILKASRAIDKWFLHPLFSILVLIPAVRITYLSNKLRKMTKSS